jgi:uncharacterized protein YkwD
MLFFRNKQKRRLRVSKNPFATTQKSKASSVKNAAKSNSIGGVFATSLHHLNVHKSQQSLDTRNTELSDSTMSITWSSSESPRHHKGAPLMVQRSPSLIGGLSAKQQSSRNLNHVEPISLTEAMMKAQFLPPDSDYISSNHVMINSDRIWRLTQPLVRLSLLDSIAKEQAQAMADRKELFHSEPTQLMEAIGRPSHRLGENVSSGSSVRSMHIAMQKNLADKNNMIDRRFTSFGIGTAKGSGGILYLCQIYRG